MAAASATGRADGVSSAPTGLATEAASPVRVQYGTTDDDGVDSGDNARSPVPQTPSSLTLPRVPPQIAPPGDASAPSVARQIVPGIGIKMSAKETKRLRRSEIEKRSRERRQGSVSLMRAELDRLERQYELLMSVDENATRGAIVRPGDVSSLRARFLLLSAEASALRDEEKSLREMLHEKQLFSDATTALLSQFNGDDAATRNAVTYVNYVPLPPAECFAYMREAYETVAGFEASRNLVSSGMSIMGWTDKRRLDEATNKMYFAFTKRLSGEQDPARLMAESWEMFCDQASMRRTIFSSSVHVNLELLQVVSDDVLIMRRHTRYVAMQRSFHTVYLLFRMRTERGYMISFRTIPCPSVENAMEEGESWIEIFHWLHIDLVPSGDGPFLGDEDQLGTVEISFGGSIGGSVIKFAMHWMIELIMTVIRWENACVAPMFITAS